MPFVLPDGSVGLVRGSFTEAEYAEAYATARAARAALSDPPATVPGPARSTLGDNTMSAPLEFDTPGGGELFVNAEHVGELLVVKVLGIENDVVTENGTVAEVIRADVTVVLEDGTRGDEFVDTFLFGKVILGQLKRKIGRTVLGVWYGEPGVKRGGKNVAYQLNPATPEQTELAVKAMSAPLAASAQPDNGGGGESEGPAPTDLGDTPPWERKS